MANINDEGFLELSGLHQESFKDQLSATNFPILKDLSPLSLRVLNQASTPINVAKGVQMIQAGDTPHDLYFISQGSIAIAKEHEGKVEVVAKLNAGDFYGEYGALRGKTRFASVYTAEPSVIVRVDLNAVQQVIESDKVFKTRIMDTMKLRVLNSFLFSHSAFKKLSAVERHQLSQQLSVAGIGRGNSVFEQGDIADRYYLILSGEAEIFVNTGHKEMLLEIRRDNGVLGEVRMDGGKVFGYSVRAADHLDLLELDQTAMKAIQRISDEPIQLLNLMMHEQVKKTIVAIKKIAG